MTTIGEINRLKRERDRLRNMKEMEDRGLERQREAAKLKAEIREMKYGKALAVGRNIGRGASRAYGGVKKFAQSRSYPKKKSKKRSNSNPFAMDMDWGI